MSIVHKGMKRKQIKAETDLRRDSILNCRAFKEGTRFTASEGARVMGGRVNSRNAYHQMMGMVKEGLLQSHKMGKIVKFSKPGVDYLRIPWREHSNAWIQA